MFKVLPLSILALALASPALAHASTAACDARAEAITAQLERNATTPMTPSERSLARRAALASCLAEAGTEEVVHADPEPPARSGFQRFVAGLSSMESKPTKKRSGKYRYIEKD